jgi:hypothetical protein
MIATLLRHWLVPAAHAASPDDFFMKDLWVIFNPVAGSACLPDEVVECIALRLANFVAQFVWAGCVIAIIWGGIKIASSAGNDEGRTQGKAIVTTAMIGFALALTADVVIDWARTAFGTL